MKTNAGPNLYQALDKRRAVIAASGDQRQEIMNTQWLRKQALFVGKGFQNIQRILAFFGIGDAVEGFNQLDPFIAFQKLDR